MSSSTFFTKNLKFGSELSTNQSPLPGIGGVLSSDTNGVFKIAAPPQPPSFVDGLTLQTDISSISGVKWGTPSASSVTLANAGTGLAVSLVEDGVGPALETRGLLAGTDIGITQLGGNVTLENTSPASSVTLANGGTGLAVSLVEDGTGPDLETRGLLAGTGIDITQLGGNVTLATNADASVFEYSSGNVISNTSNSNYNVNANMVFGGPPTTITNTQQAVILGGNDHTITNGNDSVIVGGNCNVINGADAAIIGGDNNNVTGENASTLGGNDLTVNGDCSCCIVGDNNEVNNGQRSVILGGGGQTTGNTIDSANDTVILGGTTNSVLGGSSSSILGGNMNTIQNGNNNVIFGGESNTIGSGFENSMIGGQDCTASHSNVFMWGDGQASTSSINNNSVTFRCGQGMRIFTTSGSVGVSLGNGDTSWGVLSDRNQKENIVALDDEMCREIAEKFMKVDINQYNYKETPKEKICYGPMAQDWHGEFRCENVTEPKLRTVSSSASFEKSSDGTTIEIPVLDEKGEPEMVTKPAKDPLTIPTMDMIGILMTTVRHLYKEIDLLKKRENRSSENH